MTNENALSTEELQTIAGGFGGWGYGGYPRYGGWYDEDKGHPKYLYR